ncbi:hypothetical protein ACFVIY_29860 [Streptomyces sp. NPDC127166]|uniref:hypothetical protein n=1 Tax=Streptomyces sp. NPDC127166 TaxID=3345380 RepID=UPI00362AF767
MSVLAGALPEFLGSLAAALVLGAGRIARRAVRQRRGRPAGGEPAAGPARHGQDRGVAPVSGPGGNRTGPVT